MPGAGREEQRDAAITPPVAEGAKGFSWEASSSAAATDHQPILTEANLPQLAAGSRAAAGYFQSPTDRIAQAENHIEIERLRRMAKLSLDDKIPELNDKIKQECDNISGFSLARNFSPLFGAVSSVAGLVIGLLSVEPRHGLLYNPLWVFAPATVLFGTSLVVKFFSWAWQKGRMPAAILAKTDEDLVKAFEIWKEVKVKADEKASSKKYTKAERSELFQAMLAARADQMLEQAKKLECKSPISATVASDVSG